MNLRGRLVAISASFLVACGGAVESGGSGSGGGQSAGLCGGGGEPAEGFPLIVQTLEDGRLRLLVSSRHLTCSLPEYLDIYLFGCGGFLISADFPASALTPGTVLKDSVAGTSIFISESSDSHGCTGSAGYGGPLQITIVDVSGGSVTAQVSGVDPFSYPGPINGTYVGPECGPIAHPLPNPGAGSARAWGSDPVKIVVSSEALDCNEPDPAVSSACPSWTTVRTIPASALVPGTIDAAADGWFSGKGCPNSAEPYDCPSGFGTSWGEVTIGAVSASSIDLTLDHFDDGVNALGVNGVYQAIRCP